jgi:hypothetical protein
MKLRIEAIELKLRKEESNSYKSSAEPEMNMNHRVPKGRKRRIAKKIVKTIFKTISNLLGK